MWVPGKYIKQIKKKVNLISDRFSCLQWFIPANRSILEIKMPKEKLTEGEGSSVFF